MPVVIKIENLSKQYRLGLIGTGTLSHDLNRWWHLVRGREDPYLKIGEVNDRTTKGTSDFVWALRDINIEVEQGEVLGIIGKNGAGKSTLLKILSKVTAPTTGIIRYKGRIGSLLEVGTGFHPELTGRENIYLNGSVLGMRKKEIDSKFDAIVDFSGCERYIETPVKRYSSGMTVRLGFAVAAFLEPEILVVDEVLAVGDAEFQKKAIGKMQDVSRNEGRTVLFVSHNMASVKSICSCGILLKNGMLTSKNNIDEIIDLYLQESNSSIEVVHNIKEIISKCTDELIIESITMNNKTNNLFINNKDNIINLKIRGEVKRDLKMAVEFRIYDPNNNPIGIYSPSHFNGKVPLFKIGKFEIEEEIKIPLNISHGIFFGEISLTHPGFQFYMKTKQYFKIEIEGKMIASGIPFEYNKDGILIL
jgi:lipopolysaccharide transport system ATP-binding protein